MDSGAAKKKTIGGGEMTSSFMTSLEIATNGELCFPTTNFVCCYIFSYTIFTQIFGFALDRLYWLMARSI